MRPQEIHPIVLSHINRFFGAARRVTTTLEGDDLGSMVTAAGNLLWAHSSYADAPPEQRHAMAVVGSAAGAFADRMEVGGNAQQVAAAALDDLERDLLAAMDGLVAMIARDLADAGLSEASPSESGAFVWRRLFPDYPWPCGQAELEHAIRSRLR